VKSLRSRSVARRSLRNHPVGHRLLLCLITVHCMPIIDLINVCYPSNFEQLHLKWELKGCVIITSHVVFLLFEKQQVTNFPSTSFTDPHNSVHSSQNRERGVVKLAPEKVISFFCRDFVDQKEGLWRWEHADRKETVRWSRTTCNPQRVTVKFMGLVWVATPTCCWVDNQATKARVMTYKNANQDG